MNYKEMLDKFEFLERQLAHLENENKHTRERLRRLEGSQFTITKGPGFTPGTLPQAPSTTFGWNITANSAQGQEFQ